MGAEYGGYRKEMDSEYLAMLEKQGKQDFALGAGGLGLNVAGTALQGFGAYQAWLQAEKAREVEAERYQEQKRISDDDRRRRQEQERLDMMFRYGGYAREGANQREQKYGGYAARVGL